MPEARFQELSPARQMLVRVLQSINYGELQHVRVQKADPVLDQDSIVVIDSKLDKDEDGRPELGLTDFVLSAEVRRLMSRLDALRNGTIRQIEVRAGIPRRLVFELKLTDMGAR